MYDEYIQIYIYIVVFDSVECNVNVIAGCCCLSDWLIVRMSSMSLSINLTNYKCTYGHMTYIFVLHFCAVPTVNPNE